MLHLSIIAHAAVTALLTPAPPGVDGPVHALAAAPDALYVAGEFSSASGIPAANIARWDGTSWSPLGAGIDGPVFALFI
ncbi:MAG TPA: hypothetical protein VFX92_01745, partial [Candidatus Krumholzibacteria bacterium]|nr:hypothetical protein [Candidatus Krumholzibacteria bacterium]